jgi:hypothetical protein
VIVTGDADVTVDSYAYQSYGGPIVLKNAGATIETVTELTIDGKLLVADGEIVAEAQAPVSIANYGEQTYSLTSDYIQTPGQAQALADDLLDAYDALGTELVVQMAARGMPHLQLGDLVHVDYSRAHISADGWIVRTRPSMADGLNGELTILTEGQPVADYGHGYITGTVQLEGHTDYSGVTVSSSGVGDPVVTGADGTFTLTVRPGTGITVTASHPCYLDSAKTGVAVDMNDTTAIGATTMLAGDIDRDGLVTVVDIMLISTNLGNTSPPVDPKYDVDGDGAVEMDDLNLVMGNWNKAAPTGWQGGKGEKVDGLRINRGADGSAVRGPGGRKGQALCWLLPVVCL